MRSPVMHDGESGSGAFIRKASHKGLAQKTLHHCSPTKAPGRHRAGRVAVARPGIYPGRPSCGAGGVGLLGPGVCGLGGADTLNIGYSLWQDCPCIVSTISENILANWSA